MINKALLGGFLIDININLHNYIFSINIKTHNKTSYMFYYIASNTDLIN